MFKLNSSLSNVYFGSTLKPGEGIKEHLTKNPDGIRYIEDFKRLLLIDGKDYAVSVSCDNFTKSPPPNAADIEAKLKSREVVVRMKAAMLLGDIDDNDTKLRDELIEKAVNDPDINVKIYGAKYAGKISNSGRAIPLIKKLIKYPDSSVRTNAAQSIKYINPPELAVKLIKELWNDNKDIWVRNGLILAASSISNPKLAVQLVKEFIRKAIVASDNHVKIMAAQSVYNINDFEMRRAFMEELTDYHDYTVNLGISKIKADIERELMDTNYSLKITEDEKLVGEKLVPKREGLLEGLKSAYKSIAGNYLKSAPIKERIDALFNN